MRQIANVKRSHDKTVRVMVYDDGQACYIFYFDNFVDRGGFADTWHESAAEAKLICVELFGIEEADWETAPDPQDGCQHDIIAPTSDQPSFPIVSQQMISACLFENVIDSAGSKMLSS